jgi:hypothetical protein
MQSLSRGTNIGVAVGVISEFILAEQTCLDRRASLGTRHIGFHPSLLASLDFLDLEITLVGHDVDFLDAENLLRWLRCLRQQPHVDNLVGDLLLDNEFVLGIHRDLNVVAHGNPCVCRHRPAVGVGEGDLVLSSLIQTGQHLLASRAPLADRGDLLRQVLDTRATGFALGGIALVETLKVIIELGVSEFDELGERRASKVTILVVDGVDPSAVYGEQFATEQIQLTAQQNELPEDRAEGIVIDAAEVGDGLEVGFQVAQQPDHLDVAVAFGL